MVEFVVMSVLALTALLVFAVLASVFGLVIWLVFLPFRLIGWAFQALLCLIALPFVALFGVVGFLVFGAGVLMFLLPVVPFVLIALGAWWLVRRAPPRSRSTASVTS